MYQQREPEAASFTIVGPWDPEIVLETDKLIRLEATPQDRYAAIDEIIEDVVRLAVSPWPDIDAAGRLRFRVGEVSVDAAFGLDRLEAILDAKREALGQLSRPLRVGDAFFIRDFAADQPEDWQVVDVTRVSRDAARRAALRAVAQPPEQEGGETPPSALSWRQPPEETGPSAEAARRAPSSSVNPAI